MDCKYFTIDPPPSDGGDRNFRFLEVKEEESVTLNIPLRNVVRSLTSQKLASIVTARHLYYILGKLDWLKGLMDEYNTMETDVYHARYIKYQLVQAISGLGYQIKSATSKVVIPGLTELITAIQAVFAKEISFYKQCIKEGSIVFDALQELYKPGTTVRGIMSGWVAGFRVVQSYYQERKSLFGFEQSFHLELQYIATLGEDFVVIEFESVLSRWVGESNRKIADLSFAPAEEKLISKFVDSGEKYCKLAGGGGSKYLQHGPGCVFLHSAKSKGSSTILQTSGRIMIDVAKGANLGHHASQGADEASHALVEVTARYKRFKNEQRSLGNEKAGNPDIPKELLSVTWPALVGFSFTSKSWCHVLVSHLKEISFNDSAFEELVLDPQRKRLIKALVRLGNDQVNDIIEGKSGGSIFLLHGPAGVGKTLTAEAIAEVLHKPLYYVTMGEMGVDPTTMEDRLGEILDLCAGWNALTLIDEADVFLEKRNSSDILKNAMTCVMLRLLEYHQGILFLTTNRVTEFDPALESRVTVALKYSSLTEDARSQVWRNMTQRVSCKVDENLNYAALGKYPLNGRQIKNAVRLAVALAVDGNAPMNMEIIEETIKVTSIGRTEMENASKW